jgi:hypothetical protein
MISHTDSATFRELIADDNPLDEMCEILSNHRRRVAVVVLGERDEEIGLNHLSRAVAKRMADGSSEPSTETVDRLRTSLHHVHLPKLADAELIAYDVDRRVVYPANLSDATVPTDLFPSVE